MKFADEKTEKTQQLAQYRWKILIVDDEPDIIQLTKISLKTFVFSGCSLELIEANSYKEALVRLHEHDDIALAIIDVVMETDDAGLRLVEYIRKELNNKFMRLMIRTGQPGYAPARYVIENFDIDDYKNKTELTSQNLYTSVRCAIKSYRDLKVIDLNRTGLQKILQATPEMHHRSSSSLQMFFEGMLDQLVGICHLEENSLISSDTLIGTVNDNVPRLQAGTGRYKKLNAENFELDSLKNKCWEKSSSSQDIIYLDDFNLVVPLHTGSELTGFVYLETRGQLSPENEDLIKIFANQCSSAMENRKLQIEIQESFLQAINMLAKIAEYKDSDTGNHIDRMANYALCIAKALNYSIEDSELLSHSARLHDVGKIGIPEAILQKPAKLSKIEFDTIKSHTILGSEILSNSKKFELARITARSHHERWDGKGYPDGLAGNDIPISGRIISIIDVFDALISKRPYKKPWSHADALEFLKQNSGSQFDPELVKMFVGLYDKGIFKSIFNLYPVDTM